MMCFRCMLGVASGGKRLSYRFNFKLGTFHRPYGNKVAFDFFPIKPPSVNFTDNTYIPPAANTLHFNF